MFSTMKYKIAVFPGDGVGPELINEGIKVIDKAAELDKFEIEWVKYPYGAEHYTETKELLSEKALKEIKANCNVIYCGTFDNSIKEVNGIENSIRNYFDQFVCLRPVKLLPSVEGVIAGKTQNDIDFAIIRENTEDMYIGASGKAKNGKSRQTHEISNSAFKARFGLGINTKGSDIAYNIGILSRKGCERIARYAFEYAKSRNRKVTSVDKVNTIHSHTIWREAMESVAKEYQGVEYEFNLIDAVVMNFLRQPEKYQVIVTPNLFGGILSDLGTMLQGGLLFAAQGNINPEGISMFEPIHGCAAKLKGHGIVNPIATIWAGALMLENLGQHKSANLVIKAIESVLKEGRTRTQDLDGHNTTSEMGDAIVDRFVEIHD